MRMTSVAMEEELINFVKEASEYFAMNIDCRTYSHGEITPGCLFAVRWGLSSDCVLVFNLGEQTPRIYQHCIKTPWTPPADAPVPTLTFDDDIPF
jgi:hypothetical protein